MSKLLSSVLALLLSLVGITAGNTTSAQYPIPGGDWTATPAEVCDLLDGRSEDIVTENNVSRTTISADNATLYGVECEDITVSMYAIEGTDRYGIYLKTAPVKDIPAAVASITGKLGQPIAGSSLANPIWDKTLADIDEPETYLWLVKDADSRNIDAASPYWTMVILYGDGYVDTSENHGMPEDAWRGSIVINTARYIPEWEIAFK